MKQKKYVYDLQKYETIRYFGDSIYTLKINIAESEEDQGNPLSNIVEFNNKFRPRSKEGNYQKGNTYENAYTLYEGR